MSNDVYLAVEADFPFVQTSFDLTPLFDEPAENVYTFAHDLFLSGRTYLIGQVAETFYFDRRRRAHLVRAIREGGAQYLLSAALEIKSERALDKNVINFQKLKSIEAQLQPFPELHAGLKDAVSNGMDLIIRHIVSGDFVKSVSRATNILNQGQFFYLADALFENEALFAGVTTEHVRRLGEALIHKEACFIGFAAEVKKYPHFCSAITPQMFDKAHDVYTRKGWDSLAHTIVGLKQTFAFNGAAQIHQDIETTHAEMRTGGLVMLMNNGLSF